MEGVRVFSPGEWVASGMDATSYAAMDLKKSLEGLAQHLFGKIITLSCDTFLQIITLACSCIDLSWAFLYLALDIQLSEICR